MRNGEIIQDKRIYLNWTEFSVYCYLRGCNCEGCSIKKMIESPCMMKSSVIRIVQNIGRPTEEIIKGLKNENYKKAKHRNN